MELPAVVRRVALAACALLLACGAPPSDGDAPGPPGAAGEAALADAVRSRAAFAQIAAVLRHPRCLNCHTVTDFPRTGDQRRRHAMNVRRGPEDQGLPGMTCSACHRPENQDLAGLPGAPHWQLAPLSMAWEGLDDHDLAESLGDRARNGDRSLQELLDHMADDPLVGWAWEPGLGRAPPPVSRADVVAAFRTWIDTGAITPPAGTTSTF